MELKFNDFLAKVQKTKYETNVNAKGIQTIQQTMRNKLRIEGEEALFDDLQNIYENFDVLQTKDGIVFVSHNSDFEFSMELKLSIKSTDYDPYFEADDFAEQKEIKQKEKEKKAAQKAAKIKRQQELRNAAKNRGNAAENEAK